MDDDRSSRVATAPRARGGVSPGGVLTGVVVAVGAVFLLSALIGGVLAATVTGFDEVSGGEIVDASVAGGIAFVVAQFLAYLWGGYTAGRMARGAGLINGILVPIAAILIAIVIGGIAAGLGASAELNLPFRNARLPLQDDYRVEWGVGFGIAALVAMFIGGALGGLLGARWHTKLERRAADEVEGRHLTPARSSTRRDEAGSRDDRDDATTTRRPAH
ncbi:MAG TPA: hypothetical protein VHK89_08000 [Actinomycetota bacterium]|nr:hypothetical protein [Actinomycetota bacterium]